VSFRRDFSVVDHTGDVWSVEPLPTFKQACEFRYYIKNQLNRDLDLKIVSSVRPEKVKELHKPKPLPLPLFSNSEF
jgi:hypothetical protein